MTHAKRTRRSRSQWLPLIVLSVGLLSMTILGGMLIGSPASADGLSARSHDQRPPVPIETAKAYSGDWSYAEDDYGRSRVDAAVRGSTRSLGHVGREVVRDAVRDDLLPASGDVVRIDVYRDTLDIDMPHCEELVNVPLDEWVNWRCGDRELRVIHRLSGKVLVQRVEGDELDLHRCFQVEGAQLVMSVKVEHVMNPEPLYFSVRYTR